MNYQISQQRMFNNNNNFNDYIVDLNSNMNYNNYHGRPMSNQSLQIPNYSSMNINYNYRNQMNTAEVSTKKNLAPILLNGANVYQVKFKKGVRYYVAKPEVLHDYQIDDIVVVEADRGEDLGVVKGIFSAAMYCEARRQHSIRCGSIGVKEEEGSWDLKYIDRLASLNELQILSAKTIEEAAVTQRARELAYYNYRIPIKIIDSEFQFDRNKLTIIYETNSRVDFRDLVRDLFSIYKVRIWMQQIEPSTYEYADIESIANNDVHGQFLQFNHDLTTQPNGNTIHNKNGMNSFGLSTPLSSINNSNNLNGHNYKTPVMINSSQHFHL